jgi:hypothetical protein
MEGKRRAYRNLVGTSQGRPVHRRDDNIKIDLREIKLKCELNLSQDREQWWALLNAVMNIRVQ